MGQSAYEAVKDVASGKTLFSQGFEAEAWVIAFLKENGRIQISPEGELELWTLFAALCEKLGPKCTFNKKGIASGSERKRRNAMFTVIRTVDLRSKDEKVRELFKGSFGQISLAWMMTVCKTSAPALYYEWAFDAIKSIDGKVWGPAALSAFNDSPEHMSTFEALEPRKRDHLLVKRIMTR